jgi:hypothetical protein
MKNSIIIAATVLSILFCSCNGEGTYSEDLSSNFAAEVKTEVYNEIIESSLEKETETSKTIDIPARSMIQVERKLIKEGTIAFETDSAKKTKRIIHQVANKLSGYLARDDEHTYGHRIEHNITIRVPSENFDKLLVSISQSVKELDNQNITVKDVTEEYVDVQARLKAKKIVEKRYLELLSKAHSVEDVLQVEHELARLREEIESTEGRLRYLKDQVSLSTLNITFYETLEVSEVGFDFFEKIANGFSNGFKALLWFFIGVVNVWPFLLFIGVIIWPIRLVYRKKNKKKM